MYKNRTAYALAAILLFIIVLTVVGHHGRQTRQFAQSSASVTVASPEQAYNVWEEKKLKGRVLLLFDGFPNISGLSKYEGDPRLFNWNFIEFSIFKNILRKIYLIVPDQDWEEFRQSNIILPIRQVGNLDRGIMINNQSGILLIATTPSSLPDLTEEPLVYINDQKFDAEKTMDLLSRKKIVSDVIICYHAQ
jgi:hypothetical protein